jgi:hypothetical protein
MSEYAWQAATILGAVLWNHGLWALLGTLFWGALFAVLGIATAVGVWLALRKRGWLDYGVPWDRWQRIAVLVVSIVIGAGLLGTAGLFFGAERAVVAVIAEEKVATLACREAAEAIAVPLIREANARAGVSTDAEVTSPRASMRDVWTLRERGWDVLAAIEHDLVGQQLVEADDAEITQRAKLLIARWALDHAHQELLGDGDARLVEYLERVEDVARDDGTVGVEEFAAVLGGQVLEPAIEDGVGSIFGSFRSPLYLWFLVLLATPPLVALGVRYARRRMAQQQAQRV